jgi:hypothetical protein
MFNLCFIYVSACIHTETLMKNIPQNSFLPYIFITVQMFTIKYIIQIIGLRSYIGQS